MGVMRGDCKSTCPTALKIFGSLANHPRCEYENKNINLENKGSTTWEATFSKENAYIYYICMF